MVERRAKRLAQWMVFPAQPVDPCAPDVWGIQVPGGMPPTPARSNQLLGMGPSKHGGTSPPPGVGACGVSGECESRMKHNERHTLNEEGRRNLDSGFALIGLELGSRGERVSRCQ